MASPPSFYGNLGSGAPAPQVDPGDLKSLWEFVRTGLRPAESVGFAHDLLAKHCIPGANVVAVMFRCQFFVLLMHQGLLAPWLDGDKPSEFLFQVFATYPVQVGKLDTETLLQQIQEQRRR